jgi:DNA repair exonuclease SbcCD ATPase subunit
LETYKTNLENAKSRAEHIPVYTKEYVEDLEKRTAELAYRVDSLKEVKLKKQMHKTSINGLATVGCAPNFLSCPLIDASLRAKRECDALPDVEEELRDTLSALKIAEEEMRVIKDNRNRRRLQLLAISDIEAQLSACVRDIEKVKKELDSMHYVPTDKNVKELMVSLDRVNKDVVSLSRLLGSNTTILSKATSKLDRIEGMKVKELPELRKKCSSLEILERAFSRYGIAHYLASSALPELQEIFTSLVKIGFDTRFQVVFDNIIETSKKLKESFSIIKTNALRPHDVRSCSAGEKSVLQNLWKLTLLIYQARRNESYRVLFLDEPTTGQDATNTDTTISVLRHVANNFDQVLLVTHDDILADIAENRIVLGE